MALKIPKKIVYAKVNAKVEDSIAQELDQFVDYVREREGADHVSKDVVIQEILREYLAGTSADVRQWRQHQAAQPLVEESPQSLALQVPAPAPARATQAGVKNLSAQVDQALNLGKEDGAKPALAVSRERLLEEQQRVKNSGDTKI
jgi:hypothetical protein